MAIPKFFDFFRPTLELLNNVEAMKVADMCRALAESFHLQQDELSQLLPSGKQTTFKNRVNWSVTYLKNACLIERVSHGTYRITAKGKNAYNSGKTIDLNYLNQIESFQHFHSGDTTPPQHPVDPHREAAPEITPKEAIETAFRTINDELAKALLQSIMQASPDFFEKLVVDLLLAMGYGYGSEGAGQVTGHSGDGGIDGIINEDKLGFSQVYVQAKRWNETHTVSGPDVQGFIGALVNRGAIKGLFITTSRFTDAARLAAKNAHSVKVVLIDGGELTRLMIENGVGVSPECTYKVMQIDNDYFEE